MLNYASFKCLHDVKKQIILSLEVLKIGISLQEIKYIWP